jgi:hypothetical protein
MATYPYDVKLPKDYASYLDIEAAPFIRENPAINLGVANVQEQKEYDRLKKIIEENKQLTTQEKTRLLQEQVKQSHKEFSKRYDEGIAKIRAQREQAAQLESEEKEKKNVASALDAARKAIDNVAGLNLDDTQKDILQKERIINVANKYNMKPSELLAQLNKPAEPVSVGQQQQQQPIISGEPIPQRLLQKSALASLPSTIGKFQGQLWRLKKQHETELAGIEQKQNEALAKQSLILDEAQLRGESIAKERDAIYESEKARRQQELEDQQNAEKERQDMLAKQTAKLQTLQDNLGDAKVDPDRFWDNKSTFDQVRLVLGAALMEAGAAFGGPGGGLKILNAMINRDIEAQKAAIQNKRAGVTAQQNLISMTRAQFSDDRAQDAAARALAYNIVETELDKLGAKAQNEQVKRNYATAKQELQNKRIEQEQQALQYQDAWNRQNILDRAAMAETRASVESKMRGQGEVAIPGMAATGEKQINKEDIKEISKTRPEIVKALTMLDRMEAHIKKYGTEILPTDAARQGKMMGNDFQMLLKGESFYKLGILSESDKELLDSVFPSDINQFRQGVVQGAINEWRNKIITGWRTTARQRGFADKEIGATQSVGFQQ